MIRHPPLDKSGLLEVVFQIHGKLLSHNLQLAYHLYSTVPSNVQRWSPTSKMFGRPFETNHQD